MSSQISPGCVSLALVDDDMMALAHLEPYFPDVEDFTILIAMHSPHVVLRFVQSHQIDVLIIDVHMERMDGVGMTREALRLSSSTRAILLTAVDTDEDLLQGLGVRASDFLLRSTPAEGIIATIRMVHSRAKVVAPTPTTCLTGYTLASVRDADGSVHLSQREHDILHLLRGGVSNHRIAPPLAIAEAAVESRIAGLFHKTRTVSCLEIMVWAFEHGYASNSPITIPATSTPSGSTPGSTAP